jgi:hypothetical protein
MLNMRIVYSNAADRATLTASSEVGNLKVSHLKTDIKSQVWRTELPFGEIIAIWNNAETINFIGLPFTNLTKSASVRVRGYTNISDALPVFDTTSISCIPYSNTDDFGWEINSPGVDNFGIGGAVYASLCFAGGSVKKVIININDLSNPSGYIESGRLILGKYWELENNPDFGLQMGFVDTSNHERNDAGDLMTQIKTRYKKMSFSLNNLSPADRLKLMRIMRGNGMAVPIFIALYPVDAAVAMDSDEDKLQDYQIYGKLSALSDVVLSRFDNYTSNLDIIEI